MPPAYGQPGSAYGTPNAGPGNYPIAVEFPVQESYNRFWAIPVVGIGIKYLILIPHFIILYILGAVVNLLQLVLWIVVLIDGRYPDWGYSIVGGYIRWTTRVFSYLLGLSDAYPSFSTSDTGSGRETTVVFQGPLAGNRLYAIPLLGYLIKVIMLIPHIIVLYILLILVYVSQIVLWIPVLFTGRYPQWGFTLVGGTIRWAARVACFFYGLTDAYPPFRLSD